MKTAFARNIAVALLVSVAATPSSANDDLVRGILGLGGAIILNEMQKNQNNGVRNAQPNRSGQSAEQAEARELRREVQRRLNLLGFNAGTPDGVYGRRTRTAIAQFQSSIGRTPDGRISEEEIAILYSQTGGGTFAGATGAQPGVVAAPAPAFPSVAGQNQAVTGAQGGGFPVIGGGAAAATQPQSGFPTLGGGAGAQTGGQSAFPQLGAAGSAPSGGGNAFPTIGTPPAGASASFPSLQQPQGQAQPGTSFPGVASAPEAAQPQPLPGLAAAPAEGETAMPKLAPVGAATASGPALPVDFAAELAKTAYGEADAQPKISGITLTMPEGELEKTVADNGFTGCAASGGHFACSREADTLSESIDAWTANGAVWAVRRNIAFKAPVPRAVIESQLAGAYPHLMAGDRIVSSSPYCNIRDYGESDLTALFEKRSASPSPDVEAFVSGPLARALDLAGRCPVTYVLDIQGAGDAVTSIRMIFFDGTGINTGYLAAQAAREEEKKMLEKQVTNDLKL